MLAFVQVIDGTTDEDGDLVWHMYTVDTDGVPTLWETEYDDTHEEAVSNGRGLAAAIATMHRCGYTLTVTDEHIE